MLSTLRRSNGLSCRNDFLFPIENHFNKLFDNFFNDANLKGFKDSLKATQGYPKMDILEDNGFLMVKVAVPGMKLEDLKVEIEDKQDGGYTVTISGKMSEEHKPVQNDPTYYVRELRHSQFTRVLQIPNVVVEDQPCAELKDGILTLSWELLTFDDIPPKKKTVEIREG